MDVGSADCRSQYTDQDFSGTYAWEWDILKPQSRPAMLLDERAHGLHHATAESDKGWRLTVICCRSPTARRAAFTRATATGPPRTDRLTIRTNPIAPESRRRQMIDDAAVDTAAVNSASVVALPFVLPTLT
jgi:hypothetical protein